MRNFSQQLQSWRIARGFTTLGLAQRSGIARPNLISLEQGERECTLKTLRLLAKTLDISVGTLLEQEPPPLFKLNRHERDRIIRYLLGLASSSSKKILRAAQAIAPVLVPILRAVGKEPDIELPRGRTHSGQVAKVLFGQENFNELIRRCNKLAAAMF